MSKLRLKELAEALNSDTSDLIAICILLKIPANSPLTSLTIEQCKKVVEYYEEHSNTK